MNTEQVLNKDYKQKVTIRSTAKEAFEALIAGIQEWWGDIDNPFYALDDIFKVSWGEPWYQFKAIEFQPYHKITWECVDANQIIGGMEGVEKEWVGTKVCWIVEPKGDNEVIVYMEHEGLIPQFRCFDVCSSAWDQFITEELKNYLENKD